MSPKLPFKRCTVIGGLFTQDTVDSLRWQSYQMCGASTFRLQLSYECFIKFHSQVKKSKDELEVSLVRKANGLKF